MEWIITNMDKVLQAVVPGYLSIWIFRLFRNDGKAHSEGVALCVMSVFLSTVYGAITTYMLSLIAYDSDSMWIPLLITCILGVLCGFVSEKIVQSSIFIKTFGRLNRTSPGVSVFRDNFEYEKPLFVEVMCENLEYHGRLVQDGNTSSDPWIVLDCTEILSVVDGKTIKSYKDDLTCFERVLINTQKIQSIKVKYTKEHNGYEPWWGSYALELLEKKQAETKQSDNDSNRL